MAAAAKPLEIPLALGAVPAAVTVAVAVAAEPDSGYFAKPS